MHADVEAAQHAGLVVGLGDHDDGGVAGAVERAQLAAQAQAVIADEVEANEDELEGALGGLDQGLVRVALDLDAVVLPERGGEPLMGARPVVDEEQLGVEAGLRDRRRQGVADAEIARGHGPGAHLVGHRLQPHEAADARHQRRIVERLRQEIVGASVEALEPVAGLVEGGHHDDRKAVSYTHLTLPTILRV